MPTGHLPLGSCLHIAVADVLGYRVMLGEQLHDLASQLGEKSPDFAYLSHEAATFQHACLGLATMITIFFT